MTEATTTLTRAVGLEVSRKAPVEDTVERIRGCLARHREWE